MKAVEFETKMTPAGQIVLPAEFIGDIPAGQQLKVVVMWESGSVDSAWRASGRLRFEEAYCAEDVVYEQLIDETPSR
jgi:hypothetical protein